MNPLFARNGLLPPKSSKLSPVYSMEEGKSFIVVKDPTLLRSSEIKVSWANLQKAMQKLG